MWNVRFLFDKSIPGVIYNYNVTLAQIQNSYASDLRPTYATYPFQIWIGSGYKLTYHNN